MKKTLTAALAAILLVTSLTGCNSANESNNSSNSSMSSTSSDNTSSSNTSSDSSAVGTGIADHLKEVAGSYVEMIQSDPNIAFYPMQQASAEGAVTGMTDDGYLYVIVHEDGAEIEKAVSDSTVELPPPDPAVDNSGITYPDNKAGEIAKRLINTNWAPLDSVTDQESVNALFSEDFKLDLCEEYFFASSMMSAQLYKLIVIKPKAGDMPA